VLGLSVWLRNEFSYIVNVCKVVYGDVEECSLGRWPAGASYGAFVGAFGLLAALVGFVPTFVASGALWIAAFVLDALATIFYLAGGIVSLRFRSYIDMQPNAMY
jgi:hypothetical protein